MQQFLGISSNATSLKSHFRIERRN